MAVGQTRFVGAFRFGIAQTPPLPCRTILVRGLHCPFACACSIRLPCWQGGGARRIVQVGTSAARLIQRQAAMTYDGRRLL